MCSLFQLKKKIIHFFFFLEDMLYVIYDMKLNEYGYMLCVLYIG